MYLRDWQRTKVDGVRLEAIQKFNRRLATKVRRRARSA